MTPVNRTLKGHKLVVVDNNPLPDDALHRLQTAFPDLQIQLPNEPKTSDPWVDATLALTDKFHLPSVEQAKKLEFVQVSSAGADGLVDKPIFTDTEISFCNASGVHGPQISEWVVGTFLAFQHHFPQYLENQRHGKWKPNPVAANDSVGKRVQVIPSLTRFQLSYLTISNNSIRGILGYGSIGRQVARVCKSMGMSVHAYTLHPRRNPQSRRDDSYHPDGLGDPDGTLPDQWFSGGSTVELHEFLRSGLDLLVIAMPLTPKTRGLISKPEFEVLRAKRTFVSNIGRGPIINTSDLIDALEQDVIRGAALDVTDPEPLPEAHPLWHAKNVIITPHVSGNTTKYMERVFEVLMANLTRFSNGKRLMNLINRKEGY